MALVAAACGSSGSASLGPAASTVVGPTSTVDPMNRPVAAGAIPGLAAARPPFDGFEQVQVTITSADGTTRRPCLLVARTGTTRDQGLMNVTDPALAGYAGMVFAFATDVTGTFWMKDTVMPLSVVFLDRGGHRISDADMAPCPSSATTCPTYPATAPYRWAIEVPEGRLAALGLAASDRPHVTVGGACTS